MAKIGLIQVDDTLALGLYEAQDHMAELMEKCLKDGADITFMPEGFQYLARPCHMFSADELSEAASRLQSRLSALARKYRSYIAGWDMAYRNDGKMINYCYLLGRDGEEVGQYVKVHIPFMEEFAGEAGGSRFDVFDLDIGRVGIMICFDNYYPESARMLQLKGAELVLFPLYGDTLSRAWEIKLRARAVDYSLYIAPCQLCDPAGPAFTGLVDPEGDVMCRLKERNSYCVVDVDLHRKVYAHTSGDVKTSQEMRSYLMRTRVPTAYKGIDAAYPVKDWDEIIFSR